MLGSSDRPWAIASPGQAVLDYTSWPSARPCWRKESEALEKACRKHISLVLSREWGDGSLQYQVSYSSPYIIPNNSPHNPFSHSLLSTREPFVWSVECLPLAGRFAASSGCRRPQRGCGTELGGLASEIQRCLVDKIICASPECERAIMMWSLLRRRLHDESYMS